MNHCENLLPRDGEVYYFADFLADNFADKYFSLLLDLKEWKPDVVKMFGKEIITRRKVIWYGGAGCSYTYSGKSKEAVNWNSSVLELKVMIENQDLTNSEYNSCLANLYHDGNEGMGWHADNEKELGESPNIAVISLGAQRKFKLKHRDSKEVVDVMLESGSLLVMAGDTQKYWLHTLPVSKKVNEPRISLTFRRIIM